MDAPTWIGTGDGRYPEWVALRQIVLRDPLGLRYSEEDLAVETTERHLLQLDGDLLLGGLIVRELGGTPARWKIRQVAVREDRRGRGIGKGLMGAAIARAREEGIAGIVLHARAGVVDFYEALGFEVVGEEFEEVGIPHRRMVLELLD